MSAANGSTDNSSDGFGRLVWSEWTKFRTVRAWRIGLVAVVLATVLLSYLTANGSHSGFCSGGPGEATRCYTGHPPVPTGPNGEAVADTFFFVHRSLPSDGSITAEITSLTGATAHSGGGAAEAGLNPASRPILTPWAKAGLIVKASTASGSSYAAVMATGSHGVRFQYDYTNDVAGLAGKVSPSAPRWLRLTRRGDVVTGYESTDGRTWREVGSTELTALPQTVDVGLFVTSPIAFSSPHQFETTLATARFTHVAVIGASTGGWHSTEVGGNTFYPTFSSGSSSKGGESADSFRISGSGDIAPALSGGPSGGDTPETSLVAILIGLLILIVLAASFVTTEYRRGLIRTTLTATPRRWQVLAAKAVVIGLASFVASLVAAAIAVPISDHILRINGNYIFPVSTLTEVRVIAGTAALVAVTAIGVLGLGALFRRSAGAVTGGLVLLILPAVLGTALSGNVGAWLFRLTPAAGFAIEQAIPTYSQVSYQYNAINGFYPLSPWAGFAVLCLYSALALGLGALALERRDA